MFVFLFDKFSVAFQEQSRTEPTMKNQYFLLAIEIISLIINYIFTTIKSIFKSLTASEKSVDGETVLITGSGHGIGRELALQYSALGATVVCWDINEELNQETVKLIKSEGGIVYGYT